jgi:hypothetical protein
MTLAEPLDQYCERLDPGFWAEPLNAWTNLAFVVAALLLWRRARYRGHDVQLLIVLIGLVGVGSFLFHTFAVVWAKAADVIPIGLVLLLFLAVYLRRAARLDGRRRVYAFAAFAAASAAFAALPKTLFNESNNYFACVVALGLIGRHEARRGGKQARRFYGCALLFAASLAFRTVDLAVCAAFPAGTHFLWHLLNGLVLYLATAALVDEIEGPGIR